MNIDHYSFHDSIILEVREDTSKKTLDFLLEFPLDLENNFFEKRILKFFDFPTYSTIEIPFSGPPTILEIINHGISTKKIGSGSNEMSITRNKIEMLTNAGNRIIEFTKCELLKH